MFKSLAALAILGAMSVSAAAQTAPAPAPAANQPQPTKPQMVKKRVCVENDDPSTTIHRTCRTVMVPAEPQAPATGSEQPPAAPQQPGR